MPSRPFDLSASAHDEMIHEGFHPDFPPEALAQVALLDARAQPPSSGLRDLRDLPWSSIDNDTSRDLDQIEVAERVAGGIRVKVGIADVTGEVAQGSPIDLHAQSETTSVYTPARVFPMLPEQLSTGLTSLLENEDRTCIVIEFVVKTDGSIGDTSINCALVRNRAQLTYNHIGPWLEGKSSSSLSNDLQEQLKLQDEAACALREQRQKLGALSFDRIEAEPVVVNGKVQSLAGRPKNRAGELIEDFMIAANEVMAQTLQAAGVSAIRRVVRSPERWDRIVEFAARFGETLPPAPDSGALNGFLQRRKVADPLHYPDVSLAVMKLMGPGEYIMSKPGDSEQGHFGLAAHDYTHSTAPNRRFADMVVQRLLKAVWAKAPAPYSDDELTAIAKNCTLMEDRARKVERTMRKRVSAIAFQDRIGETFDAVVTGVTPKGTFVRVIDPPVEGRLMRGEQGIDVGDKAQVKLISTDPQRGYIDFTRSS